MTKSAPSYHLNGRRDLNSNPLPVVDLADLTGRSMDVAGMEMFTVLAEAPMEATLDFLPPGLHPSVPAMVGITFYRAKASEIGPFTVAVVGLGCRSGIKPRMLTLAAFADSVEACAFFGEGHGYPVRRAATTLHVHTDSVRGRVELEDGTPLLDVVSLDPVEIVGAGAILKVWGPLNHVQSQGRALLLQSEMSYRFDRLRRGKPRIDAWLGDELGSLDIRPTWPVTAALATVDISFQPTRFLLDPKCPVEAGGVRYVAEPASLASDVA